MSHLRPGIVIFQSSIFQSTPALEVKIPRVWLSSGTILAQEIAPNAAEYCEGAFVPKTPWREANPEELALLWTEKCPSYDSGIGIIRLPASVLEPFAEQGIYSIQTKDEIRAFGTRKKCEKAFLGIIDYLTPLCLSNSLPVINGFGGMPPGLPTSTIDRNRGCHNGLHTDNWDQLPVNRKQEATNRICINLGREDRYFLFINLPEVTLLEMIGGTTADLNKGWTRSQTEEFMRRYPDYPVVKLRIAPGEAYIAPTENIIHDATTADKQHLDLKIMLRGHYKIPV